VTAPPRLAVYISGHGFGHLAQIAPVLEALHRQHPDFSLLIRTNIDETIVRCFLSTPFELLTGEVDIGVVQKNASEEDVPATINAARDFFSDWEERIGSEVDRLGKYRPNLVLSDISPLAFPVAKKLGIPAIGLCSLDWHAIYSAYLPADDALLTLLANAHAQADILLQPPLNMPMPSFANIEKIAPISRQTNHGRAKVRRHMNLAEGERLCMIMFGGAGNPPFDITALGNISGWRFCIPGDSNAQLAARVQQVPFSEPFSTVDYVAAADAVICKPSYNILAECWRYKIPVVYVPRPDFPEYPHLRDWLQENAPAVELTFPDFRAGNWQQALETAVQMPRCYPETNMDGGVQAAEIISSYF